MDTESTMCLGQRNLVDAEVGVRGDDGAAGEVDALARQVAAEAALLALQPLHKPSARTATTPCRCLVTGTAAKAQHKRSTRSCAGSFGPEPCSAVTVRRNRLNMPTLMRGTAQGHGLQAGRHALTGPQTKGPSGRTAGAWRWTGRPWAGRAGRS